MHFLIVASQLLAIIKTDSRVRERLGHFHTLNMREANLALLFFPYFLCYTMVNSLRGCFKFMINNKPMDKQLIENLKKQLAERKETVISQLSSIGHRELGEEGAEINFNADFPQYGESAEDSAVEVADYAKNLSVERELEKELRDIEKAIKKMADGTYGICNHCGQQIEIERLKVRPESGSCVSCKKAITRHQ